MGPLWGILTRTLEDRYPWYRLSDRWSDGPKRRVGCAILLETWNLCFASILFVYVIIQSESDSELVFPLVRVRRGLDSRV